MINLSLDEQRARWSGFQVTEGGSQRSDLRLEKGDVMDWLTQALCANSVVLGGSFTDMMLESRQGVCYLQGDSCKELLSMTKIAVPSGKEEAGSKTSLVGEMTGDGPGDGRLAGACHAI